MMTDSVRTRPWLLWGISAIVALVGALNLGLAWDHAINAGHYRDLGVSYPPELRAMLALGWGVALLAISAGLIRRRRWALRWTLIAVSNYGAFSVLWLVAFARSDASRDRIAFQAVATVIGVLALAGLLRWRRVRARFESRGGPAL